MLFTKAFKIEKDANDDFFDREMSFDRQVFIDPFSVYETDISEFINAHKKIIKFFERAFELCAKASKNRQSDYYKIACFMFYMDDAWEVGLGYSKSNVKGSSTKKRYSEIIVNGLYRAIDLGMDDLNHFEILSIFSEGIGCDRISDITCNILKEQFILYTQRVCKNKSIPLYDIILPKAKFNYKYDKWENLEAKLPIYKGNAFLLVPKSFINDLPTINRDDYYNYVYDNKNEEIRTHFGADIKKNVDKEKIIKYACESKEWILEYQGAKEIEGYIPYDFKQDIKNLLVANNEDLKQYIKEKLSLIKDGRLDKEINVFILEISNKFKNYIENNEGYKLLWCNKKSRSEKTAQSLYLGYIQLICEQNGIDIGKECNIGKGPVDFKFSNGNKKVLLEMKLLRNTRYWNGYDRQLPAYLSAEGIEHGVYMLIAYTNEDYDRYNKFVSKMIEKAKSKVSYKIDVCIINACDDKISASKL